MSRNQIEKIKAGNLEELDKVYLEIKPQFFAYATSSFNNTSVEDIEDVYQDSIIDFYNNIQRGLLTEIKSSLSAYIIQIGKMKLIKLTEKQKKLSVIPTTDIEDLIASQSYDYKIDEVVKYVFATASENCKKILRLFYFEKKSMNEIATELSYKNADTVKSKKNRCISKISEQVIKMHLGYE